MYVCAAHIQLNVIHVICATNHRYNILETRKFKIDDISIKIAKLGYQQRHTLNRTKSRHS